MESMWLPTPVDASVRLGGGGPGAFLRPNTLFIVCLLTCGCSRCFPMLQTILYGLRVDTSDEGATDLQISCITVRIQHPILPSLMSKPLTLWRVDVSSLLRAALRLRACFGSRSEVHVYVFFPLLGNILPNDMLTNCFSFPSCRC